MSELTNEQETALQETNAEFWQALPREWQEKFEGFTVKPNGFFPQEPQDTLCGTDKQTGREIDLSWDPLEDAVEEVFGHKAGEREKYNRDPDRYEKLFLDGYRMEHKTMTRTGLEKGQQAADLALDERFRQLGREMETLQGQFGRSLELASTLQRQLEESLKLSTDLARRNASLMEQIQNSERQPVAYPERPLFSRRRRVQTVIDEPHEGPPRRSVAAAAVAALAVAAAFAGGMWLKSELDEGKNGEVRALEHKFDALRSNVNHRLDHQHQVMINGRNVTHHKLDALTNRVTANHNQDVRIAKHSHRHERLTLAAILRQVHQDRLQDLGELKYSTSYQYDSSSGSYRSGSSSTSYRYEYPWDWAKSNYGAKKAETKLHILSQRAAKHGHKVRWVIRQAMDGSKKEILEVDGTTNIGKIVKVLSQYK